MFNKGNKGGGKTTRRFLAFENHAIPPHTNSAASSTSTQTPPGLAPPSGDATSSPNVLSATPFAALIWLTPEIEYEVVDDDYYEMVEDDDDDGPLSDLLAGRVTEYSYTMPTDLVTISLVAYEEDAIANNDPWAGQAATSSPNSGQQSSIISTMVSLFW